MIRYRGRTRAPAVPVMGGYGRGAARRPSIGGYWFQPSTTPPPPCDARRREPGSSGNLAEIDASCSRARADITSNTETEAGKDGVHARRAPPLHAPEITARSAGLRLSSLDASARCAS